MPRVSHKTSSGACTSGDSPPGVVDTILLTASDSDLHLEPRPIAAMRLKYLAQVAMFSSLDSSEDRACEKRTGVPDAPCSRPRRLELPSNHGRSFWRSGPVQNNGDAVFLGNSANVKCGGGRAGDGSLLFVIGKPFPA